MVQVTRLFAALLLVLPGAALAAKVKVPVDVGIGPAANWYWGPLVANRGYVPHFGLKINVDAVLDKEFIDNNRRLIPPQYQKMAQGVTEVRVSPSIFIPDELIISPKIDSLGATGVYGVTWRPFSIGVPLTSSKGSGGGWRKGGGGSKIDLQAGLLLTYLFIYSDFLPTTHFIRPGIDVKLEAELMASDSFGVSLGYAHQFYVPQKLGTFGLGPLDESIFHVSQAFLKLHFRFPYETNL